MIALGLILLASSVMTAPAPSGFVYRDGKRFYLNGEEHFVFCANYWQAMNLGAVDSAGGNRTRLLADLDAMKADGINNLRIMAGSEGPDNSPYRMTPTLMPKPGIYNEEVLDGLDFAMAEIAKRGMKAVVTFNDFWHWSGGFSAYVSWVTGTPIPYPPSWSKTLGDYTTGSEWSTFIDYSARFYNDDSIRGKTQELFKNHIQFILNRKNKYSGVLYKEDPTVFSWQLANEPQSPPVRWIEETATFIKSIAPHHMVSSGLESNRDEKNFMDAHTTDLIDYATVHVWVQNAGVYDMLDSSEANIANAIKWAVNRLDWTNDWASKINKPIILEEFGMARDNWVAQGDKSKYYNPSNPTTNRDRYYKAMFNTVAYYNLNGGAYAGFGFWAYAGQARPTDQWISDPPHEAPGWYAVYDKDVSTINIMKEAYARVSNKQ